MPTYEYECETCHHYFDEFQKMTDKPIEKCPKCGKKIKKLISLGSGFIFKGSGFYITDYKKNPSPTTANTTTATKIKKEPHKEKPKENKINK